VPHHLRTVSLRLAFDAVHVHPPEALRSRPPDRWNGPRSGDTAPAWMHIAVSMRSSHRDGYHTHCTGATKPRGPASPADPRRAFWLTTRYAGSVHPRVMPSPIAISHEPLGRCRVWRPPRGNPASRHSRPSECVSRAACDQQSRVLAPCARSYGPPTQSSKGRMRAHPRRLSVSERGMQWRGVAVHARECRVGVAGFAYMMRSCSSPYRMSAPTMPITQPATRTGLDASTAVVPCSRYSVCSP